MNRLFISTKEHYIPNQKIVCVNWSRGEKSKVRVYDNSDELIGYLRVSSEKEARWFVEAIFTNQRNDKNLIINYKTKTITESNQNITTKTIEENIRPRQRTSIQTLEVEEDK